MYILSLVFNKKPDNNMTKQQIYKMVATIATAIVTCVAIALGLQSCNVTRSITTRSETWQRGDTSVVIQTKTIETYDAKKNLSY